MNDGVEERKNKCTSSVKMYQCRFQSKKDISAQAGWNKLVGMIE